MLKIYTLGKQAYLDSERPLTFRTQSRRHSLLSGHHCKASRSNRFGELFWSDMTSSNAQKNLRTVLPGLRALLGEYLTITNQQITFNREQEHWADIYELQHILADSTIPVDEKLSQLVKLLTRVSCWLDSTWPMCPTLNVGLETA